MAGSAIARRSKRSCCWPTASTARVRSISRASCSTRCSSPTTHSTTYSAAAIISQRARVLRKMGLVDEADECSRHVAQLGTPHKKRRAPGSRARWASRRSAQMPRQLSRDASPFAARREAGANAPGCTKTGTRCAQRAHDLARRHAALRRGVDQRMEGVSELDRQRVRRRRGAAEHRHNCSFRPDTLLKREPDSPRSVSRQLPAHAHASRARRTRARECRDRTAGDRRMGGGGDRSDSPRLLHRDLRSRRHCSRRRSDCIGSGRPRRPSDAAAPRRNSHRSIHFTKSCSARNRSRRCRSSRLPHNRVFSPRKPRRWQTKLHGWSRSDCQSTSRWQSPRYSKPRASAADHLGHPSRPTHSCRRSNQANRRDVTPAALERVDRSWDPLAIDRTLRSTLQAVRRLRSE